MYMHWNGSSWIFQVAVEVYIIMSRVESVKWNLLIKDIGHGETMHMQLFCPLICIYIELERLSSFRGDLLKSA